MTTVHSFFGSLMLLVAVASQVEAGSDMSMFGKHAVSGVEGKNGAELAVHSMRHTVVNALSGSVHAPPGMKCRCTCNGEMKECNTKKQFSMGECWGKLAVECSATAGSWNMSNVYRCHGAFTYVHTSIPDIPDVPKSGEDVSVLQCDGAMMYLNEVTKSADAAAAVAAPEDNLSGVPENYLDLTCPSGKCVSGMACVAESEFQTEDSKTTSEATIRCNDMFVGAQLSHDSDGERDLEALGRHGGHKHGCKHSLETPAEHVERILSDTSAWGSWFDSAMDGAASWFGTKVPEGPLGAASLPGHTQSSFGALPGTNDGSMIEVGRAQADQEVEDVDSEDDLPDGCTWTCNHHKLPLHGWWPCMGEMDFKCDIKKDGVHAKSLLSCNGFSVPQLMVCKGLWERHDVFKTSDLDITVLAVSNGKKKYAVIEHHGWVGVMNFGRGMNTLRMHTSWKGEEVGSDTSEDATRTVDKQMLKTAAIVAE